MKIPQLEVRQWLQKLKGAVRENYPEKEAKYSASITDNRNGQIDIKIFIWHVDGVMNHAFRKLDESVAPQGGHYSFSASLLPTEPFARRLALMSKYKQYKKAMESTSKLREACNMLIQAQNRIPGEEFGVDLSDLKEAINTKLHELHQKVKTDSDSVKLDENEMRQQGTDIMVAIAEFLGLKDPEVSLNFSTKTDLYPVFLTPSSNT